MKFKIFLFLVLLICSVGVSSATSSFDGTKISVTGGIETLTSINSTIDNSTALEQLSSKEWLLKVPLHITSGTFNINSADCDWLKIKSNNDSFSYIYEIVDGNINISSTKITSWDTNSNTYDINRSDGRAYIRMTYNPKITNSNLSYLGYNDYGSSRSGVGIDGPNNLNIHNNIFNNNYCGIWILNSANSVIHNNTVNDNYDNGIRGYNDYNILITGNQIDGTSSLDGIRFNDIASYSTISNNVIRNTTWGGIHLPVETTYVTIDNNTIYNAGHVGIDLHNTISYVNVTNNTVINANDEGIFVHNTGSNYNFIFNNTVSESFNGFKVYQGHNNTFKNNTAFNNTAFGFLIQSAGEDNLIQDSIAYSNGGAYADYGFRYDNYHSSWSNTGNLLLRTNGTTYSFEDTNGTNTIRDPISTTGNISIYRSDTGSKPNTVLIEFTNGLSNITLTNTGTTVVSTVADTAYNPLKRYVNTLYRYDTTGNYTIIGTEPTLSSQESNLRIST